MNDNDNDLANKVNEYVTAMRDVVAQAAAAGNTSCHDDVDGLHFSVNHVPKPYDQRTTIAVATTTAEVAALLVAKAQASPRSVDMRRLAKAMDEIATAQADVQATEMQGHNVDAGSTRLSRASAALDRAMEEVIGRDLHYPLGTDLPEPPVDPVLSGVVTKVEEVRELALIDLFADTPWAEWQTRDGDEECDAAREGFRLAARVCQPRFDAGTYGDRELGYDMDALAMLVTPVHCVPRGEDMTLGTAAVKAEDLARALARVGSTFANHVGKASWGLVLAAVAADV